MVKSAAQKAKDEIEAKLEVALYAQEAEVVAQGGNMIYVVFPQPAIKIWSANQRLHRQDVAKRTRHYRRAGKGAGVAIRRHLELEDDDRLAGRWMIDLAIGVRTNQRRDPHNYSSSVLKAVVDGLVDAGLFDDDNPRFVSTHEPDFVKHRRDEELTLALVLAKMAP